MFLPEGLLCSRFPVWSQQKHVWMSVRLSVRPCLSDVTHRIAGLHDCRIIYVRFSKTWSFFSRSCKGVFRVLASVLEMRVDDCRCWYQDCRIARSSTCDLPKGWVLSSFWCSCKGVFRVLGSVLEMFADVDILISRCIKVCIFPSLNTIALRPTLPCRCNLV